MTKRKIYSTDHEGGIHFQSQRRPGEVRIPNYVYDLWMPLLGAEAIGVYAVYCRLEMHGDVKKITLAKIAQACRIGTRKLAEINDKLRKCGFIEMFKPSGSERLKHYTTRIVIKDAPASVSAELINEFKTEKGGYTPLTEWLVDDNQMLPNISGDATQHADEMLDDTSKIATLDLQPLNIESHKTQDETRKPHMLYVVVGTKYKDGHHVDPLLFPGEVNALFYAYVDVLKSVGRDPAATYDYLWEQYRDEIKTLALAKVTPEQLTAYVKAQYEDTQNDFWRNQDHPLPLKNVIKGIASYLKRESKPTDSPLKRALDGLDFTA